MKDTDNEFYSMGNAFEEGYQKGKELNKANKERKIKVAERIKKERKIAGYTQETFSIKTNINRITYSGYEVGRAEPTIECLVRIADTLNLSLDYLCCRTDEKNKNTSEEEKSKIDELIKRIEVLESKNNA